MPRNQTKRKTALEKMKEKQVKNKVRKDLHTMVLEAEGATVLRTKKGKSHHRKH